MKRPGIKRGPYEEREPQPLLAYFPEELAEDALPDYGVAGWEI